MLTKMSTIFSLIRLVVAMRCLSARNGCLGVYFTPDFHFSPVGNMLEDVVVGYPQLLLQYPSRHANLNYTF